MGQSWDGGEQAHDDEQTGRPPGARGGDGPGDEGPRVVVLPPEGDASPSGPGGSEDAPEEDVAGMVAQPAKVMRIGTMVKQLLDEVREAPLDDAARARLAAIHERSLHELEEGLSPELVDELHRITLPFGEDAAPSDAELRIAQAQLVGWLEGLFHGIQTALVAQQMATQAQLQQMRRALPPGPHAGPPPAGLGLSPDEGTGQYL